MFTSYKNTIFIPFFANESPPRIKIFSVESSQEDFKGEGSYKKISRKEGDSGLGNLSSKKQAQRQVFWLKI
jgi:hypothetical protein